MSPIRRLGRTWTTVSGTAVVAAAGAVVAGLVLTGSATPSARSALTPNHSGGTASTALIFTSAASTFTISGEIYASPTCSGSSVLLYPGVTRCEVFSVTNNMGLPITVQSITTTLTDTGLPAVCSGTNLTLPSFTASQQTPAFVVEAGQTVTGPGEPIALNDSHANQNPCAGLVYHFNFSGTASYTDTTRTGLKVSSDPSTYGQAVTWAATVTGNNPNTDTYLPAGTVSFYSCASATSCSPSPSSLLGMGNLSGGIATLTSTSLPLGNTYVEAVYPGSSTDYLGSISSILTETVDYDSTVTGSQTGGVTVRSGQAVEVASGGKVTGSVTVASGGILYLNGGTLRGGLTVQAGGTFNMSGGTVSAGTNISGAKSVTMCGATTLSGGVNVSGVTGPLVIGNPAASCAANSISGGLTVTSNTGGVTVNGNKVTGGATIDHNTGPVDSPSQKVSANTISGGLSCSGNTNLVASSSTNSVSGPRSGQCTGGF